MRVLAVEDIGTYAYQLLYHPPALMRVDLDGGAVIKRPAFYEAGCRNFRSLHGALTHYYSVLRFEDDRRRRNRASLFIYALMNHQQELQRTTKRCAE